MSATIDATTTVEAPTAPARDRVVAWAAVASCALFAVHLWVLRGFVTDDSWISVRYAENLGSGQGLGWNPGGDPVEGFSNPLLVLVEAAAHALGLSAMGTARVLGVAAGLGCVLAVHLLGRHVVGTRASIVGGVLTAACAPLALWSVGGLETTVVALLLTAAALELARPERNAIRAGWLLAPLPWLRPEALAVAGALLVAAHLTRDWRRPPWRSFLVALAPVVASQVLLQAVRWFVFGNVVPNSARYKVGTGGALDVPRMFVEEHTLLLVAAVVGLALLRGRQRILAVTPVVYLLGSIGTLDSANGWSRFLVPVLPQVALLAGVLAAAALTVAGLRHRVWAIGLAAALVVATMLWSPSRLSEVGPWQRAYMDCKVEAREQLLDWLPSTPPGTTMAISDAGLVPARAGDRHVIDSFLLNEASLQETGALSASERADRVHDLRPDLIVLASDSAERFEGTYVTDQLIHDDPRMGAYTQAAVTGGGDACAYALWAFRR
jgi:arabinofuranosyltransferase